MSEGFLGALLFFGVITLIVISYMATVKQEEKRRAELVAFAAANGWEFVENDNSLTTRWEGRPFAHGSDSANEIFHGRIGSSNMPFIAFTYTYTETSTNSSGLTETDTYPYEVRALQIPRVLPRLEIAPEETKSLFAKIFGSQDIDFESDDFNRAFLVRSTDQRFAYGVIHPHMMEWMLGPGRVLVPWRIDNDYMITFEEGILDINRFPSRLETMVDLVHQIPQHVWDEFGR